MNLIVYDASATSFKTFGLGVLGDAYGCKVTEERNGSFELTFKYPMNGPLAGVLVCGNIVGSTSNPKSGIQAFRIKSVDATINGKLSVTARHISYDMSGIPVAPFEAASLQLALSGLMSNAMIDCPFTLTSSRTTVADFEVDTPTSLRSWLGGKTGSLLDVYGGEWEFDNFTATLHTRRGSDTNVEIRYGKNLIDLEQEKNIEATYSGVIAYWDGESGLVMGAIQYCDGAYLSNKIYSLDVTGEYTEAPTTAQLNARALKYIENNECGIPKVDITLDFVQLGTLGEQVNLCDTVHVYFERLGVDATAKCIKTVWNPQLERYTEIELGEARTSLVDAVVNNAKSIETQPTMDELTEAINRATTAIKNGTGGYVRLNDTTQTGNWDELLIMDTPDPATCTKLWRWNLGGLGYSKEGYDGTYGTAITMDGEIVADFITAGTLTANIIRTGRLQALSGSSFWDLDTGELQIYLGDELLDNKLVDMIEATSDAAKVATNYLYYSSSTGLIVAEDAATDSNYVQITGNYVLIGNATKQNVYIDNDSLDIRVSDTVYATFTSSSIDLNPSGKTCAHIGYDSTIDEDGNTVRSPYYSFGIRLYDSYKDIGSYSVAEGYQTTAAGAMSHAEGKATIATGLHSHAEGSITTASGQCSHAEGWLTIASNGETHAEGYKTVASGPYAHAEGCRTKASSRCQHVFGRHNIEDAESTYVEIVGVGLNNDDDDCALNARMLDWKGNETLAGALTVGVGTQLLKTGLTLSGQGFKFTDGSGYYLRLADSMVYSDSISNNTTTLAANVCINSYLMKSTASSKRYKHDIKPITAEPELNTVQTMAVEAIEAPENDVSYHGLLDIEVVSYKYNEDYLAETDTRYLKNIPGFIAEQVEEAYPIAVDYTEDDDGNEIPEDWNPRFIIPGMLALIQELYKKVEALENGQQ